MAGATIHLHRYDLPEGLDLGQVVAVDTETMGLNPHRDRLCLVQLSSGDGHAHLVQLIPTKLGGHGYDCPNLRRILADLAVVKLMHFARFDVAVLQHALDIKDAAKAEKVIRAFADASKPDTTGTQDLGTFNLTVLGEGARLYQQAGLVKTRVDVTRYFTNDLVARV